jgi:putative Holliday junction resolvase
MSVSDELGLTAQGLPVRQRTTLAADLTALRELCSRYAVEAVVVGLPKNMDGSLGGQAQKTLAFIEHARRAVTVPVIAWDERLTTQAAERALLEANMSRRRRRTLRDRLAAQLILQSYLDWRRQHPGTAAAGFTRPADLHEGFAPENDAAEAERDEVRRPNADQQ